MPLIDPCKIVITKELYIKIVILKDLALNLGVLSSVCGQNRPSIGVTGVKELSPGFPGLSCSGSSLSSDIKLMGRFLTGCKGLFWSHLRGFPRIQGLDSVFPPGFCKPSFPDLALSLAG
jgi:hypothetical protein